MCVNDDVRAQTSVQAANEPAAVAQILHNFAFLLIFTHSLTGGRQPIILLLLLFSLHHPFTCLPMLECGDYPQICGVFSTWL